nr:MCP four helix bundle domain-containing protein [Nitrosomonas sp.]
MFTNTSIKFRLMFVMSILSVLMVGIGALGLYGFNHSNTGVKNVYQDRLIPSVQLGSILDVWYQVRENARNAIESKNTATAKALERRSE